MVSFCSISLTEISITWAILAFLRLGSHALSVAYLYIKYVVLLLVTENVWDLDKSENDSWNL